MIKLSFKSLLVLCLAWSASAKLNDPRGFWKDMAVVRNLQVDNGIHDDIENGVTEGSPLENGGTEGGLNLGQCEGDVRKFEFDVLPVQQLQPLGLSIKLTHILAMPTMSSV